MNILLINKFYYYRGGAETHFFALQKMLESRGHKVVIFSTKSSKTVRSIWMKYFPKYYDLVVRHNIFYKVVSFLNLFFNIEANIRLRRLIRENDIDIAHVHNIYHHISPSILKVLKNKNIPIVMTLHDYKLICPNYSLFNFKDGNICEKCKNGNYFNCYKNRCIKNSKIKSLSASLEMYFQKKFFSYEKLVDVFIAPSEFIKNKFFEFGFSNKNIEVIHNFANHNFGEDKNIEAKEVLDQKFFLYFGRLAKEKGLDVFLKALSKVKKDFNFYIIGSGPEEKQLKKLVSDLGLDSKVRFLGFFGKTRKQDLDYYISKAEFVVVPSLWYENCSMTIVESMVIGKLVMVSNLGGNTELVEDDKTGIVFDPYKESEIVDKIERIIDNRVLIEEMSKNAQKAALERFGEEIYYNKIINIYKELV